MNEISQAQRNIHLGYREPEREPPSNLEAEQALLGAILVNNNAYSRVADFLRPEHFFEPLHRKIFEAAGDIIKSGKIAHPVTVKTFLPSDTKVGSLTLAQYLGRLAAEAVTIVNVPDYAAAVMVCYCRREAMNAGEEVASVGLNASSDHDLSEGVRLCRDRLNDIIYSISARNDPQESFKDTVDKTLGMTSDALSRRLPSGIDIGIPELSQMIGPISPGELLVIGGDVKTGKSAAAWQCFFNMAERHAVAGISGEMSREQVIMREKARRTSISAKRQKLGHVSNHEIEELLKAGEDIKRLKFVDILSKQITLDDIDERINRLQGEFGIECFLIDHILKILFTGKMEDAEDHKKANKATSTLKNIALKRKIPIIAVTHINKTSNDGSWGKSFADRLTTAKRRRPTYKSMLGNIDKDVDNMIIVHQAYPAVAGLEPEEGSQDYMLWEQAVAEVKGKAEFVLALSRENEFPIYRSIQWNGPSTSFGPEFKRAMNERELF